VDIVNCRQNKSSRGGLRCTTVEYLTTADQREKGCTWDLAISSLLLTFPSTFVLKKERKKERKKDE